MVKAVVTGMQSAGVSSVLKHYPGHGSATGDTHTGLVYLDKSVEELRDFELKPFVAGIEIGVDAIMAAHIALGSPEDPGEAVGLPATLSKEMLDGLLRTALGFGGIIITDSLTMGAIGEFETPEISAILAGADMILRPSDAIQVRDALLQAVMRGDIDEPRIDQSVRRILEIKLRRGIGGNPPALPDTWIGSETHRQIADEIEW
jgi:beta-N-acetylhexosaminidase